MLFSACYPIKKIFSLMAATHVQRFFSLIISPGEVTFNLTPFSTNSFCFTMIDVSYNNTSKISLNVSD